MAAEEESWQGVSAGRCSLATGAWHRASIVKQGKEEWREAPIQQEGCIRGERRGFGYSGTMRGHMERMLGVSTRAIKED